MVRLKAQKLGDLTKQRVVLDCHHAPYACIEGGLVTSELHGDLVAAADGGLEFPGEGLVVDYDDCVALSFARIPRG